MRAFTAIDLPEQIRVKISRIVEDMPEHNLSFVKEADMHITLHFFGSIWENQKSRVIEAINSINIGKFETRAVGFSYFGDREIKVVFAKVEDHEGKIAQIYEGIGTKLSDSGIHYDRREKFIPHITIARCKGDNPKLREFIGENSEHDFGSFVVSKISFRSSTLSERGPMYSTLFEHEI